MQTKRKIKYTITKNDLHLLYYLLVNKVASRKQINRDVYRGYWPQNARRRLCKLKSDNLIKAKRPISTWKDQTLIYGLTSKGLQQISLYINAPLIKKRLESDSIEHDLNLVDIRQILKSKDFVNKYFTENQIHNEARFYEDENLTIFNQLRFDALIEYSQDFKERIFIPIQYERMEKSKERYKKIISEFYIESSIPAIIYITDNSKVENVIKEIENKIEPSKEDQKLFYGRLQDLSENRHRLKFYGQSDRLIEFE